MFRVSVCVLFCILVRALIFVRKRQLFSLNLFNFFFFFSIVFGISYQHSLQNTKVISSIETLIQFTSFFVLFIAYPFILHSEIFYNFINAPPPHTHFFEKKEGKMWHTIVYTCVHWSEDCAGVVFSCFLVFGHPKAFLRSKEVLKAFGGSYKTLKLEK